LKSLKKRFKIVNVKNEEVNYLGFRKFRRVLEILSEEKLVLLKLNFNKGVCLF